jgi:menaquinone-dependent protoporphyrinogen oxidase
MTDPVLVAYGTRHGATAEVSEVVAETLREAGIITELLPAADVESVFGYGGIVIGAAIYMGRLHADVRHLLKRFADELAAMRVAVFAMGPRTTEPGDLDASRAQLDAALSRVPAVSPVSTTVFGGVLDPAELHFPLTLLPAVDARDWYAIRTWASLIASRMQSTSAAAA